MDIKYLECLTVKEIAELWKVKESTIRDYIRTGVLTPANRMPVANRFPVSYIERLEDVELNPMSPLERKRLEKEIATLKKRIEEQNKLLSQVATMGAECIKMLNTVVI